MEQGFVLPILSLFLHFLGERESKGPKRIRDMHSYVMSELRDNRGPYIVVPERKMWICRGQEVVKVAEVGRSEGAPGRKSRVYSSNSIRSSNTFDAV
jgi:hypothetical protein